MPPALDHVVHVVGVFEVLAYRLSSRSSHAFASFQSRMTVSTDTLRTVAVSSTLSPPKNRSSITRLFRSSTFASSASASSRATRSCPGARAGDEPVEGDPDGASASLLIALRPRVVDQDPAHQSRRHREKVRTVLPLDALDVDEPQVRLVHESRGLQTVPEALAGHAPSSDALQLAVDVRDQRIEGRLVATSPGQQQARDLSGVRPWAGRHGRILRWVGPRRLRA